MGREISHCCFPRAALQSFNRLGGGPWPETPWLFLLHPGAFGPSSVAGRTSEGPSQWGFQVSLYSALWIKSKVVFKYSCVLIWALICTVVFHPYYQEYLVLGACLLELVSSLSSLSFLIFSQGAKNLSGGSITRVSNLWKFLLFLNNFFFKFGMEKWF